jgi:hypothetical protein
LWLPDEEESMSKDLTLPAEVTDHFARANVLHTYVQETLGDATKHALETGQELMAAKAAIPHGRWEEKCDCLFDGSLRTAQFYMQFAKDFGQLKSAGKSALLLLEGTLDGAAKAARKAAVKAGGKQPPKCSSSPQKAPDRETGSGSSRATNGPQRASEGPQKRDYGKCPNCAGTKWDEDEDGVSCAKCHHPWGEPAGDVDGDQIKTQRQKTVKTAEALMRAFDDLQLMKARSEHREAIQGCKALLRLAREWK